MRTQLGCVAAASVALLTSSLLASATPIKWEVQYHADTGVLPEKDGSGWTYYKSDPNFTRTLVNNTLNINTMGGDAYLSQGWENLNGTFNFKTGFVMEERLQLLSATDLYDRWGGATMSAQGTDRGWVDVEVATDKVMLESNFTYVSYPMNTTSGYHVYRTEVVNDVATLFVDGTQRLTLPLELNNSWGYTYFGDQGWEGGNINYAYVRYGSVPEPATATMIASSGLCMLRRRRRV